MTITTVKKIKNKIVKTLLTIIDSLIPLSINRVIKMTKMGANKLISMAP